MTDHELLELAAKAAGMRQFSIEETTGWPMILDIDPRGNRFVHWNPLTDDRDAFRLAVELRLTVSWDRYDDTDYATATPPHTYQGRDCMVDQDPYAATRRAIVCAAAEIGKAESQ